MFQGILFGRTVHLSPVMRYGTAVGAAVAAVLLRLALDPVWGLGLPFITLFPAIMLSAWLGGMGPGIVTTALTAVAAVYYWIEPGRSWAIADTTELLGVLVFLVVGGLISVLNEAWRRGEERLRVTLGSIGDAVITTDGQGRVTQLNAVAERLTGWSTADAAGRRLHEVLVIFNEQTGHPTPNPVDRVLREGAVVGLANHTVLRSRDGREIPIDDSAAPIRTDDGRIAGVVLVFRDITDRRNAERERAALLEAERAAHAEAERVADELSRLTTITDSALSGVDSNKLIHELLDRVRAVLKCDSASMLLADPSGTYLTPVASVGLEEEVDPSIRIPIGEGFAGRIAAGQNAMIIDDIASADVVNPILRLRLKSLVGAALKIGERLGVLHAGAATLRHFSETDARLLVLAADRIAVAVERALLHDRERAARREAETAAQQLQAALRAGRMGTWQYTVATGEVTWSPGLEAIHGYAQGTFPGTFDTFRDEIHPEDRDHVFGAIGDALDRGGDHHVEYRIVRSDGAVRWVEGVGQVVCDAGGRPERMLGVCADITERKQAEAERAELLVREQAARAEIERASRLKDEFLAVLSHELRTPLNAVLGYAHLLTSGALPPERSTHALEAIKRNAQAQTRLVESLLDLSRVLAGKLELHLEEVSLAAIVNAAVDAFRPEAQAKDILIEVAVPPLTLVGDSARLQQVFWNLLANAVKFTLPGGRVGVRCVDEDGHVRVLVSDSGQGISADFLPHVFDRFSQAGGEKRRAGTGLGLGLALVREMVQAHGGKVVADSPGEGHGSTFTVTLPVSPVPLPSGPKTLVQRGAAEPDSLPPMDILVVDDEADVRDLFALLLESRGATVRSVSSAGEALEAISRRRPDVLLADLRMPGEDGYSLIRRLRARERERHERRLPAIAVTAYASARERDEAMAAGYDAHLAKPVEPDELARAVLNVATGLVEQHRVL